MKKILADAHPDSDEDINEDMFENEVTEEEAIFTNQLNEIDEDDEAEHKNRWILRKQKILRKIK